MNKVTIIDYGTGNLLSVKRAFEYCGANVVIANSPDQVSEAERLVLPGVGAFAKGMAGLRERGLVEAIKCYAETERPFLGICLGMQLMLEVGEEFGTHAGLGLIKGRVEQIPRENLTGCSYKIPHIGWNELVTADNIADWENTILKGVQVSDSVYFVHSYRAKLALKWECLAEVNYNGWQISAVIKAGNLYGCQFHPEKSGPTGLSIIKNFIEIN